MRISTWAAALSLGVLAVSGLTPASASVQADRCGTSGNPPVYRCTWGGGGNVIDLMFQSGRVMAATNSGAVVRLHRTSHPGAPSQEVTSGSGRTPLVSAGDYLWFACIPAGCTDLHRFGQ